jgi:hypothetical protein
VSVGVGCVGKPAPQRWCMELDDTGHAAYDATSVGAGADGKPE